MKQKRRLKDIDMPYGSPIAVSGDQAVSPLEKFLHLGKLSATLGSGRPLHSLRKKHPEISMPRIAEKKNGFSKNPTVQKFTKCRFNSAKQNRYPGSLPSSNSPSDQSGWWYIIILWCVYVYNIIIIYIYIYQSQSGLFVDFFQAAEIAQVEGCNDFTDLQWCPSCWGFYPGRVVVWDISITHPWDERYIYLHESLISMVNIR